MLALRRLVLAALVLMAACGRSGGNDTQGSDRVLSWSNAPSDTTNNLPLAPGMVLRQFIAPHAAGTRIRLKLSNRYGTSPVSLAAVSIGVQDSGANLVDGTDRTLSFGGKPEVTLAAGETVFSDALDFAVQPFQKLGISFSTSSPAFSLPRHARATEIAYLSVAGAPFLPLAIEQYASWYVIEGLEVQGGPARQTVVALGDSITDGFNAVIGVPGTGDPRSFGKDGRYPDFLQKRLLAAGRSDRSVANAGISGNRVIADGLTPDFGPALGTRLQADVLDLPNVRTVILLEGINDLTLQISLKPQAIIDGLDAVVRRLQAAGIRVVLGTLTPSRGAYAAILYMPGGVIEPGLLAGSAEVDAARQLINDWIRTRSSADAVVDFDACLRDPAAPSYLLAEYDSSDHLHPNIAGYAAMADCVDLNTL